MKSLRNQVQLIGRLGTEPELIKFDSGNQKTNFSMATNESYKNKNGEKLEETQWHQIIVWNAMAAYVQKYFSKGDEVMIQGKITNRSYEDKEGVTRYVCEIVAHEIMILRKAQKSEDKPQTEIIEKADSLPF